MSLENPLWQYALTLYSWPGVEQCCLQLQDQGAVVNRLLFACWLARQGISLTPSRLLQLDHQWHDEVTQPLRSVRHRVREWRWQCPDTEHCYRALREAELACEQVELMLLWQQGAHWSPDTTASVELLRHNLKQVLTGRDGADMDDRLEWLQVLESAAMTLPDGD